ncbi:MAG: HtaA domain-containing protein [Arthrobacter sp.]|nr:HtaA domain-containing protein [Arthrobacter sp.]
MLGLSDGRFHTDGGIILESQSALFPLLDDSNWSDGRGILKFSGTLRAFGHFGMSLGHIIDPWVEKHEEGTYLSVVRWPGQSHRITIADLHGNPQNGQSGATLTLEGTEVFGGVYQAGTELDPVSIVANP